MAINAKYHHTDLVVRERDRIAAFDENVFGRKRLAGEGEISGEWLRSHLLRKSSHHI